MVSAHKYWSIIIRSIYTFSETRLLWLGWCERRINRLFFVRFLPVVMIDSHTCSIRMMTDQLYRCFAGILYECVVLKRGIRQNITVCKSDDV